MTGVHPDYIRAERYPQQHLARPGGRLAHRRPDAVRLAGLGGGDVAWNRRGVRVPSQQRATQVFKQLFIRGTPEEEAREMHRIRDGQSILDDVRGQVEVDQRHSSSDADRQRLDLYLSSVREAEQRLQQDEAWGKTPKPKVEVPPPTDDFGGPQLLQRSRQWYDIVHLALQTDSTRVISLWLGSQERPEIEGVTSPTTMPPTTARSRPSSNNWR